VAIRAKQTQERRVGRPLARSAGALIAFAEAAEQPPEKQRHDGGGVRASPDGHMDVMVNTTVGRLDWPMITARSTFEGAAFGVDAREFSGPCRFVALFSCPGVHTFTQFGRKTDGRYGIMPGGATAFLCTRAICFLFFSPSSSTDPAAIFNPREEGGGDPGTSRSVCPMGCSCPMCRARLRNPRRQ
jgi:hypothetical protein